MKKINLESLFPLTALVVLIFALSGQIFVIPPLGKLLDPFVGLAQNQEDGSTRNAHLVIKETGLKNPVRVFFDKRKVPHIYAQNAEDLYFAQGYVTAYLRLWQMDFITYASAGRLSELFKEGFFDYDRNQRRIGMLEAARKSLEMIEKDPETN
ncbi:MAG TPA: penicillin acylase family protein, partial [Cytophagales bacterium]